MSSYDIYVAKFKAAHEQKEAEDRQKRRMADELLDDWIEDLSVSKILRDAKATFHGTKGFKRTIRAPHFEITAEAENGSILIDGSKVQVSSISENERKRAFEELNRILFSRSNVK